MEKLNTAGKAIKTHTTFSGHFLTHYQYKLTRYKAFGLEYCAYSVKQGDFLVNSDDFPGEMSQI